ncbi:MAG: hypothetical protein ACR2PX_08905 [Endozoicomonas sp.]|uniref:hypothetical protein n=1 Tax=Endozoicomonas sp. TaxID=1892382 RepID=UPI003D9B0F86
MATTNIWQQFKSLIPEGSKVIVTITANHSNGTSSAALRDGTVVTVKGEPSNPGQKVIIRNGEVVGIAGDLPFYEASV